MADTDTLPPDLHDAFDRRQAARDRRDLTPVSAAAIAERILTKYGLATLLALAFFYWITSDVSGTMRDIREQLNGHVTETTFYLRQVCLNTAQNEAQRAACIPQPSTHD